MSFKEKMKKALDVVKGACSKCVSVTDKAEEKIMSACGSDRTMDDVIKDYTSRGWTSVKKAGGVAVEKTTGATTAVVKKVQEKAPLVIPTKKRTTKDILDEMAQDKDLAAALQYVYMNPCIKVTVTEIKDVNCDGRAPMVCGRGKNNGAYQVGVGTQGKTPATKSMGARMTSFIKKATGTKLVTVS